MIVRHATLRLSTIGALTSLVALAATAADQKPAASPCQKLTGADRTECERLVREQERPEASRPQPEQSEPPPPDTKSEGNDDSDTGDPPRG
jgi:hypothetical protein